MEKEKRNEIEGMVEKARERLEREIHEQLEGIYGLHRNGTLEDISSLPQIKDDPVAIKAREGFEYFINNEVSYGQSSQYGVKMLVLGLSFTHLNRLIALKLMERRKVIKESISRKTDSNGFKFFLADHPEQEKLWKNGKTDEAYKNFLLHQYKEISQEVHVLFDPDDVSSLVFPRPGALYELLDLINRESLTDIWEEDETIGWIYQYFTPKDLRKKAREESAAPRNSYELAFRNQFYTPRYVVRFLTDNTLGRIWYEMRRGDTKLVEMCQYMVRRPNEVFLKEGQEPLKNEKETSKTPENLLKDPFYIQNRLKKDPRDIKVLDPAVGSGHFHLYSFDLLLVIYEEAYCDVDLGPALKRDYPSFEEYKKAIPGMILRYNLHGIDIDLRATQIASLALWLRAQRAYQDMGLKVDQRPKITKGNIVCAEPMPGDKKMLEEFKKGLKPPVLGDLVSDVWEKMKLAGEAGSLLKIEKEITGKVKEAKEAWLTRPKEVQMDLFGNKKLAEQLRFDFSGIKEDLFWDEAEERVLEALKMFAEGAINGRAYSRRLFAEDATQGFALIDLMRKKYDVVLMNPPFGAVSYNSKDYVKTNYPDSYSNIASAFIERMKELLYTNGEVGLIADKAILIRSSYESFRRNILLNDTIFTSFSDLGWDVLDTANVETAAYSFKKIKHNSLINLSLFFDAQIDEDKGHVIKELVAELKVNSVKNWDKVYFIKTNDFLKFPNAAISYSMDSFLKDMFLRFDSLEPLLANVKTGLSSGDNERFYKCSWEIPPNKLGKDWFYLSNGGNFSPYYRESDYVIFWRDNGKDIKNLQFSLSGLVAYIRNESFYFKPGITYGKRGKYLNVQVHNKDKIFTNEGQFIIPNDNKYIWSIQAIINSRILRYCINSYCGQHKENGYVKLLPIPKIDLEQSEVLTKFAIESFNLIRESKTGLLEHAEFISPLSHLCNFETLHDLLKYKREIISSLKNNLISLAENSDKFLLKIFGISENEYNMILKKTRDMSYYPSSLLYYEAGAEVIDSFIDYFIGCIFGRWDIRMSIDPSLTPKLADPFDALPICPPGMLVDPDGMPAKKGKMVSENWLRTRENVLDAPMNISNPSISDEEYLLRISWSGILVDDPGHQDDIAKRVRDVLEVIWKDKAQNIEKEACEILEVKSMRDYFRKKFLASHIKRYTKSGRKAPIYWQLSTNRGNYSLWLYYHRLTPDTIFFALRNYIDPKVKYEEAKHREIKAKLEAEKDSLPRSEITKIDKEIEKQADFVLEIKGFRETLEKVAQRGYNPDFDDGVILNMAPLHEVIPWKEPAEYWKDLENDEYDWAHIAMKYWPERVKEKCKKDKSLAIAHGLEELYGAK
ncbi:MAG: BREX-1 system adenine-specific DNA-methyltransferase PglX [Candidatus Methanoperedens sp.]